MPHDDVLVEDTRAWLRKVALDLRSAQVDLDASPPILEDVVFHCQQAVEKAFKAFLTWHDRPFRKTHDLAELGRAVASVDESFEPLARKAAPLSVYAWEFRYPGESVAPTEEEARAAVLAANEVVSAIRSRLDRAIGTSPGSVA